ncbi:hypothetical protein [Streptomyces violascens]|uniref:hypothetical protein n=1 Tax=Streptomyces violascens TaxID=67381 RepID=UPI00368B427F
MAFRLRLQAPGPLREPHLVVEVVTHDMPFLVDSLLPSPNLLRPAGIRPLRTSPGMYIKLDHAGARAEPVRPPTTVRVGSKFGHLSRPRSPSSHNTTGTGL